jgi:Fe-S oxidoreductase
VEGKPVALDPIIGYDLLIMSRETLMELGLPARAESVPNMTVAYHSVCSMQHGQKVEQPPRALASAGYVVKEIAEGHLYCGSAGTYNVLQQEIAAQLRDRTIAHVLRTGADVVAIGNVGGISQLGLALSTPVVHPSSCSIGRLAGRELTNFGAREASKSSVNPARQHE